MTTTPVRAGSSFVLTRAQLSYAAFAERSNRLVWLDGGLGLLHVGADLEAGRQQLEKEGLLTDGRCRDDLRWVIGLAETARRTIVVHVNPSGGIRTSVYVAIDPVEDAAVLFRPARAGLDFGIVLEALAPRDAVERVLEAVDLSSAPAPTPVTSPGWSISRTRFAIVRDAAERGDAVEAAAELCRVGWAAEAAEELAALLSRPRTAFELTSVDRIRPTQLVIGEVSWLTDGEVLWRFEAADDSHLTLQRSSTSAIALEAREALSPEDR